MFRKNKIQEKAIKELKNVREHYYPNEEMAHVMADDIIIDLLIKLGYEKVVDEYRKMEKEAFMG